MSENQKQTDSSTIILAGLKLNDEAEVLAKKVWQIGNRLTEFDKKENQILEACQNALEEAYAKGWKDART